MNVSMVAGRVSPFRGGERGLHCLRAEVERLCDGGVPLKLAVTETTPQGWRCEVDSLQRSEGDEEWELPSIFTFRRRRAERTHAFNAVILVPTGIDCAIGGHAGDATPAARLLASVCDQLVLHPNVVNASDVNEQPENCLYVEGSLICRLLMGAVSLRRVRSNRILVVTEEREHPWVVEQVVNSTSAARATLGADCTQVVVLRRGLDMRMGESPSGRAIGEIGGFDDLFAMLRRERGRYDAVALSTRITPLIDAAELLQRYFRGEGPNPWGGVEATLTHTVSTAFGVPSAHAPTMEDVTLRMESFGQVDPRKSAEAISTGYMFCVLKGLHRAPGIVADPDGAYDPSLLAAEDVSCLVVPAGSVGLPTLAALVQGITVIAVRENANLMRNDLRTLPFAPGQLWEVDNYLEAAGLISALKAGIHPSSLRRPLAYTPVVEF
ncbi:MAG TPA: DUF3326 domain-containing protein [Longimicrobium sp.]|nr:DUF3326 domain-containing protein [Longimicrobium sp.]